MDSPGAFILLFRGNEKDSRLDINRFTGPASLLSIKNFGDWMSIDLGGGRELAVLTATETLNPGIVAHLRMRQRNWFVALPFPAEEQRNLHFFQHLIDTFSLTQLCAVSVEREWELCNQLLWRLSPLYPHVTFYMEVLPNDPAQSSDVPSLPPVTLPRTMPIPGHLPIQTAPVLPSVPEILLNPEADPLANSVEEAVSCVICQECFMDGMVTLCCCQVLCTACYQRVRKSCPMCRASPLKAIDGVFDSNIAYKNDNIEEMCSCGKAVKRRNRELHDAKECPNRQFQCPGCLHPLPFASLSMHLRDIHRDELLLALIRIVRP